MKPIELFLPSFDVESCLAEVRDCLERGWTGLGYKTVEFEQAWCLYTGHPHSHFLNSATAALHLAVNIYKNAYGWADGDEVITSSLTFVATNHVILQERLQPVFADVDEYLCLDPAEVEKRITARTRAVMYVGLGGNTGRLADIQRLCKSHGLILILDAAHMAGTRLFGTTPTADVVCYSFQAVKNLPTADAGMICFADEQLDAAARKKAWLGISKDTFKRYLQSGSGNKGAYTWRYDVDDVGFKYHGNALMAGIALAQLQHLDRDNECRRRICATYERAFAGHPAIETVPIPPGCISARHLYQIQVDNQDGLVDHLNACDIFPGVHYRDNTDYPMFSDQQSHVPNARRLSQHLISLPLHLRLSDSDVSRVVDAVLGGSNTRLPSPT